ncbi:hypothetical protein [Mesorhizobium sp.]|uniref:hypothetical protein n=1 Tax=Mesorhizobium sp. TaxID=1871066 RepID=UPI0025C6135C|nr:hypothetical protein [Mesorhizobium sp.]
MSDRVLADSGNESIDIGISNRNPPEHGIALAEPSGKMESQRAERQPICVVGFRKRTELLKRCLDISYRQIRNGVSDNGLPAARRKSVKSFRNPPGPHYVVRNASQECRFGKIAPKADPNFSATLRWHRGTRTRHRISNFPSLAKSRVIFG